MTASMWRMPSRIAVSGSSEWFPVERVDVTHVGGGAQVTIETWPTAGTDIDQFVADHATALAADRSGWTDLGVERASVIGRDGRRRRAQWLDGAGNPLDITIGYRSDEVGMVVVTIAVREGETALVDEAVKVAGSITLGDLLGPDATATTNGSSQPDRNVANDAWAEAARAWRKPERVASETESASWVTFEEALASAARHGTQGFPGVRAQFLSRLDPAQTSLALQLGRRSIEARAIDDPALSEKLGIAAAHDLLVVHEQVGRGARKPRWIAARPEQAVVIESDLGAGRSSLRALAPEDLVAEIVGTLDASVGEKLKPFVASRGDLLAAVHGSSLPEDPALACLADDVRAINRVRTVYRSGEAVAGGEVEWLDAGPQGAWRITAGSDPQGFDLAPVGREELTEAIAEVLPGG